MNEWQGKSVILDNHTLGVVMSNGIQILRASVLRGSPIAGDPNVGLLAMPIDESRLRQATRQDFDDYRVQWHPDYKVVS